MTTASSFCLGAALLLGALSCGGPAQPASAPVAVAEIPRPTPEAPREEIADAGAEVALAEKPAEAPSAKPAQTALPFDDGEARKAAPGLEKAAELADLGKWAQAAKLLTEAMKELDASGSRDAQMQAHAMLGRAHAAQKQPAKADEEYQRVLDLEGRATSSGPFVNEADARAAALRRVRELDASGEALFHFAEKKRRDAEALRFPRYSGPGDKDSVTKHVSVEGKRWVEKRLGLRDEAEKAYRKILDLRPAPPPRWVVAASAGSGMLSASFVDELLAVPIPAEWKLKGPSRYPGITWEEIRTAFYDQLKKASAPELERARATFTACVERAAKYRIDDEHSRRCADWLAKHPP